MTQAAPHHKRLYRAERHLSPPGDFVHEFQGHVFDSKKAARVLELIAGGMSQLQACREMGNNPSRKTLQIWALRSPGFSKALHTATQLSFMAHADDMLTLAGDGSRDWREVVEPDPQNAKRKIKRMVENPEAIRRDALKLSVMKWLLPKVLPDKYGALAQMGGATDQISGAPAWLKLCSPQTQMKVAMVLAEAKQEGEARVVAQQESEDAASVNGAPEPSAHS